MLTVKQLTGSYGAISVRGLAHGGRRKGEVSLGEPPIGQVVADRLGTLKEGAVVSWPAPLHLHLPTLFTLPSRHQLAPSCALLTQTQDLDRPPGRTPTAPQRCIVSYLFGT